MQEILDAETLISDALDQYGEWINNSGDMFPAANISEATAEELRMMLALLYDDHLRTVMPESLEEFHRWVGGEDVPPWSAWFVLNWLVLRRELPRYQ